MGDSISFADAWLIWLQGKDVTDFSLYGFSFDLIARIAKVMTFIGGGTILADLIGPDGLRAIARRMRRAAPKMPIHGPKAEVEAEAEAEARSARRKRVVFPIVTGLGGSTGGLIATDPDYEGLRPAVLAILSVVYLILAIVLVRSALPRIADLLEKPDNVDSFKWTGYGLIVVSFPFDLLTT